MSKTRRFLYLIFFAAAIAALLSPLSLPAPKSSGYAGFSAERAAIDIKHISKEPHSIEHPAERAVVRDYIASRLLEMKLKPEYYQYDSVINRFRQPMDIANLYTRIDPPGGVADSYILLVAHIDSRFKTKVRDRYVYSLGAADDGYGVAVILELLNNLLKSRNEWKHGIKVLFTDSEESALEGMKYALKLDSHIFYKVNLAVNIEARGVKGPALLFETSPGNKKLIELYKEAKYPYTYSLTSAVYNIMPNSTDFSCIKDNIPGFNFSVIDNLNYYHTDLDNYDNISLRSIQHYGEQILPMVKSYLSNPEYADMEAFVSAEDGYFFTIPHIGLFVLKGKTIVLAQYILIAILLLSMLLIMGQRRLSLWRVLKITGVNIVAIIVAASAGYGISYLTAMISGQRFNLTNVPYIGGEYIIIISAFVLIYLIYIYLYRSFLRRTKRYTYVDFLSSATILLISASILSYYFLGDNTLFFVPAAISSLSLLLNIFAFSKYINFIGWSLIIIFLIPLFYCLIVALTIGALAVFLALFVIYMAALTPLSRG